MKERPILFSAPMVRALLDGSKSQTRRIVKPDPGPYWNPVVGIYNPVVIKNGGYEAPGPEIFGASDENQGYKCPYGQPGDRLWVRETFLPDPSCDDDAWDDHTDTYHSWSGCGSKISGLPPALRNPDNCIYKANWVGSDLVWRPSIHMPRWASRILLELVAVRVERLQDISHEDAEAEGVKCNMSALTFRDHYENLWEQINGADSWSANPWVWVVEFKRVKP
jgi:hypothetical protein